MSIYVADATAPNLLPADLSTEQTSSGTAVQVDWPGLTNFKLATGTVAGANKVVIEGCETSDFSTADVVTLFTFDVADTDDDVVHEGRTDVRAKYIRATVTIGTGGDMDGSVLTATPLRYHWTKLDSAAALA